MSCTIIELQNKSIKDFMMGTVGSLFFKDNNYRQLQDTANLTQVQNLTQGQDIFSKLHFGNRGLSFFPALHSKQMELAGDARYRENPKQFGQEEFQRIELTPDNIIETLAMAFLINNRNYFNGVMESVSSKISDNPSLLPALHAYAIMEQPALMQWASTTIGMTPEDHDFRALQGLQKRLLKELNKPEQMLNWLYLPSSKSNVKDSDLKIELNVYKVLVALQLRLGDSKEDYWEQFLTLLAEKIIAEHQQKGEVIRELAESRLSPRSRAIVEALPDDTDKEALRKTIAELKS